MYTHTLYTPAKAVSSKTIASIDTAQPHTHTEQVYVKNILLSEKLFNISLCVRLHNPNPLLSTPFQVRFFFPFFFFFKYDHTLLIRRRSTTTLGIHNANDSQMASDCYTKYSTTLLTFPSHSDTS